jgi:XTP/dITP diphosphohydrolase
VSEDRRLVVATTNAKKAGEMRQILLDAGLDLELLSLSDCKAAGEVAETGATFLENARIKALAAARDCGLLSIADDGGLEIDALSGMPGVQSHRFLGESTPFPDKMREILTRLGNTPEPERAARFRCAVVIASPGGDTFECEGVCEGRIAHEMRGTYGFGYDPIFYVPRLDKHMAELTPAEKHRISHRGEALRKAIDHLRTRIPPH